MLDGVLVERAIADRLNRSSLLNSTGMSIQANDVHGRADQVELLRCRSIGIGTFEHRDIVIEPSTINAFGLSFLCRYQITLTSPDDVRFFTPVQDFNYVIVMTDLVFGTNA